MTREQVTVSRGGTRTAGHRSRTERLEHGAAARRAVPPAALAGIGTVADRDPVSILLRQGADRVPELLPIRYGRMLASPFAFYRGAAAVMAADLAAGPSSGLEVQLCGDAHLSNFGVFGSPERRLVFDLNDFDETHPGPFEWDAKRLAASLEVVGRHSGLRRKQRRTVLLATASTYREAMQSFARGPLLESWYAHVDVENLISGVEPELSAKQQRRTQSELAKARARDSMQALSKLTAMVDGARRIVADPPLVVPLADLLPPASAQLVAHELATVLRGYRRTVSPDRRRLVEQYRLVDVARKVVGVGSVGTRAWILLVQAADDDDTVMLQAKQAVASVLEEHLGPWRYTNHGARVVAGQRQLQATSDIFLGWQRIREADGESRDYYIRQLQDWKRSVRVDRLDAGGLTQYGRLCAWTLARAHARSGDRIALAAYLGDDDQFDQAMLAFAVDYADLNQTDHARLVAAADDGAVPVLRGV
jgi:uncharacterized protein (DUF2252 family)